MKSICRIAGAVVFLSAILAPDAEALRGRGAAFAVGAAAGSSKASAAEAEAAAAQQQAATANQQAAAAQQQAAAAEKELAAEKQKNAAAAQQPGSPMPPAAAPGQPLPLGTVVPAIPAGCVSTPVNNVNYYYCGGNFYKAAYQGSTLVYVTTEAK